MINLGEKILYRDISHTIYKSVYDLLPLPSRAIAWWRTAGNIWMNNRGNWYTIDHETNDRLGRKKK